MDHAALRVRVRQLVERGALPGAGEPIRQHRVTPPFPEAVCAICEEAALQVTYMITDGRRVHLHAACEAVRLTLSGAHP